MSVKDSNLKHLDFLFWDIVSLCISFVFAYWLRFGEISFWKTENWSILLLVMIFLDIILTFIIRPYKGIFRRNYYQEIRRAFQLTIYNAVITFVIFYVFHIGTVYSRAVLLYTYIFYFCSSVLIKYAWKKHLGSRKHEYIPVFIFSNDQQADTVIRNVMSGDFKRFEILGIYITDGTDRKQIEDIPVFSEFDIDSLLSRNLQEVLVAVQPFALDPEDSKKLVDNGVLVNYSIDALSGIHPEESHIRHMGIINTLAVGSFSFSPGQIFYLGIKRIIDILLGIIGSLFLIPLYIFVKAAYLLDGDKEKVIYRHTRIGKGGKKIRIFKFRSMVPNADKILVELLKDEKYRREWEENQKLDDDPRITKVGKILRKTSVDELPQLLNVLIGDMSIVGPRPLVQGELEAHNGLKLYQKVRPGITGWWGCNGRSDIDYKERLELEYYYVKNVSFSLDFICILRTAKAILQHKGAK